MSSAVIEILEIKDLFSAQIVDGRVARVRVSERDVLMCVTESGNVVVVAKGLRLHRVSNYHLSDVFLRTEPMEWLP